MIPLDRMPALVASLMQFDRLAKTNPLRVWRAVSPRRDLSQKDRGTLVHDGGNGWLGR